MYLFLTCHRGVIKQKNQKTDNQEKLSPSPAKRQKLALRDENVVQQYAGTSDQTSQSPVSKRISSKQRRFKFSGILR